MKKLLSTDIIITELAEFCNERLQNIDAGSDFLLLQGLLYLTINEHAKAIINFSNVIQKDPSNESAYYLRSRAYYELDDFDKSYQDYLRALKCENPEATKFNETHPEQVIETEISSKSDVKDIGFITDQQVKEFLLKCATKFQDSLPVMNFFAFHFK